jgi:hypothetical protein
MPTPVANFVSQDRSLASHLLILLQIEPIRTLMLDHRSCVRGLIADAVVRRGRKCSDNFQ